MVRLSSSSPVPSASPTSFFYNQSIIQTSTAQEEQFVPPSNSIDNKITLATAGLQNHFVDLLKKQSSQNAETIADYVLAMNVEVNPSIHHMTNQIRTLSYLSNFHKQKPFSKMTRDDIVQYLDSHRRPEESDPLHKWIGTYNLRRVLVLRFSNGYIIQGLNHQNAIFLMLYKTYLASNVKKNQYTNQLIYGLNKITLYF